MHLIVTLLIVLGCVALSLAQSCPKQDRNVNDWHFRGANIGGWLVLEPWITPSLFYQFLGAYEKWGDDAPNRVAFDSHTFCTALGAEEANKQLRRHWSTWVTEEQIMRLAIAGIDTLRVPVGDWLFVPYEPYIGCYDGALEELQRLLRLCEEYKLKVLLDIHGIKGSQNAFDNCGKATIKWTSPTTFEHILTAGWIGDYNITTGQTTVKPDGMKHGLKVVQAILDLFKNDATVIGLEALNEPWYMTPIDALKEYYWSVYQLIQKDAPHWISIFHDSFRSSPDVWKGFLENCPNFAFDVHLYQAWADPMDDWIYSAIACQRMNYLRDFEKAGIPIIIGEWSLATDNCAMWLNGFNDNIPSYPKRECYMIKCVEPYMGKDQPGAPPDPSKGPQDPFGAGGRSHVAYGMCPVGAPFPNEDKAMKTYARAQLQSFESTHGQFFWNFRTELEYRWSFLEVVKRGWLPSAYDPYSLSEAFEVCGPEGQFLNSIDDSPKPNDSNMKEESPVTEKATAEISRNQKSTAWVVTVIIGATLLVVGAFVFILTSVDKFAGKATQYIRIIEKSIAKDKCCDFSCEVEMETSADTSKKFVSHANIKKTNDNKQINYYQQLETSEPQSSD